MEPVSLFRKNYKIEISDADFNKHLKLSTLFSYFQEIGSMAVENLGMGIDLLQKKYGVAWVLLRMRVDVIRNPELNEEIIVETWQQLPQKIEFDRDYLVRDKNGEIIARAVSSWVIIDINTRKIKKSELIRVEFPENITERAIDCKLGKIKPSGNINIAYKKMIGYSDIDFNGHLNNAKYIDYIMDCFPVENHVKYGITSLEINYTNEALPGDSIIFYKDISELDANLIYIEGMNEKDHKIVFKSQVVISAR
jgi:medium-chain acyl-[acyl-carrier-protein] hydrolase